MEDKIIAYQIFSKTDTIDELLRVCASFKWLIDNGFMVKKTELHTESLRAFNRITKEENYGN